MLIPWPLVHARSVIFASAKTATHPPRTLRCILNLISVRVLSSHLIYTIKFLSVTMARVTETW